MNSRSVSPAWTRWLGWAIVLAGLPLVGLDIWVHRLSDFHPHFDCEHVLGFYAWSGGAATLALLTGAWGWAWLVRRQEGYYDE